MKETHEDSSEDPSTSVSQCVTVCVCVCVCVCRLLTRQNDLSSSRLSLSRAPPLDATVSLYTRTAPERKSSSQRHTNKSLFSHLEQRTCFYEERVAASSGLFPPLVFPDGFTDRQRTTSECVHSFRT